MILKPNVRLTTKGIKDAGNTCNTWQYADYSADETKNLSKLMVTTEKIKKKLHHNISNISSNQKWFGLLSWLFGCRTYINATQCLLICCLEEIQLQAIVPPLTLIYIDNGCEDHRTNIYIPKLI